MVGIAGLGVGAELYQYAAWTFGVEEGDAFAVGTGFGCLVNEGEAFVLQALDLGLDVVYGKGDVVDAFAALVDKLGDGTVGIGGVQQFDLVGPSGEKGGGYAFAFYHFTLVWLGVEELAVEGFRGVEVFDGYADMFDFVHGTVL